MYELYSRAYITDGEEKHTWSTNYSQDTKNIRMKGGELIKSMYREMHWIYSDWKEGKKIIFLQGDQPTPHLKSHKNPICLRLGPPGHLVIAGFS